MNRRIQSGNALRYGAALAVFLVGTALSVYAGDLVRQWHRSMVVASFFHLMELYVNSVEASIESVNENLDALRDYMSASGALKPREFDLFTSALLRRHPEIDAVMWVPRLQASQLGALENLDAAMRKRGDVPAMSGDQAVWPIQLVTPESDSAGWYGADARTHPLLREPLRKAIDEDEAASSYAFARDGGDKRDGFLVANFVPSRIQVGSAGGGPVSARGGFVVSLLNIPKLIESGTQGFAAGFMQLRLLDSDGHLLGRYGGSEQRAVPPKAGAAAAAPDLPQGLVRTLRLTVADREWRLVGRPGAAFSPPRSPWEAAAVALLGTLFSLVSAIYLANVTGEMISRRKAEQRLRAVVKYDGLTGLKTRMEFFRALPSEWQRARRYGHELSILMIDLDYFKTINDTYGHTAGDRVLREVGAVIGSHTRTVDTAARYGGEEFILLLSETGLEAARAVARRIHEAIGRLSVDVGKGVQLSVSATIGAAAREADVDAPMTLVRRADLALYRGKDEGRNRIRTFADTDRGES